MGCFYERLSKICEMARDCGAIKGRWRQTKPSTYMKEGSCESLLSAGQENLILIINLIPRPRKGVNKIVNLAILN